MNRHILLQRDSDDDDDYNEIKEELPCKRTLAVSF